MNAETFSPSPVRPDLAEVEPLYYPIVERRRFASIKAMCRSVGLPIDVAMEYVRRAMVECSDFVVMDDLVMGNPDDKVCAVVMMRPGGVVLCCGLFAEATPNREQVESLVREFATAPEFKGKLCGVGEFRPNPRGLPQ